MQNISKIFIIFNLLVNNFLQQTMQNKIEILNQQDIEYHSIFILNILMTRVNVLFLFLYYPIIIYIKILILYTYNMLTIYFNLYYIYWLL